jgi:hypothetical protein
MAALGLAAAEPASENGGEARLSLLVERLRSLDTVESRSAAVALAQMGGPGLGPLLSAAGDPSLPGAVRVQAVEVLGWMAPARGRATGPLLRLAADRNTPDPVRVAAFGALADLEAAPPRVVPLLRAELRSDSGVETRLAAVRALGRYGPHALEAGGDLRSVAAGESEERLRAAIAAALREIEGVAPERRAHEDAVREAVIRHRLRGRPGGRHCVTSEVGPSLWARLADLGLASRCSAETQPLELGAVLWLAEGRAQVPTRGVFDGRQTESLYDVERAGGGWEITRIRRPSGVTHELPGY